MQKYQVTSVVLAPFRIPKTDCGMNTNGDNGDDDTVSVFSFEDHINADSLLGLLNGYGQASHTSTPVVADGVTGDGLMSTSCKAVLVYHSLGSSELFDRLNYIFLDQEGS